LLKNNNQLWEKNPTINLTAASIACKLRSSTREKGKTTINLAAAVMHCHMQCSKTQVAQGKNDAKTRKL